MMIQTQLTSFPSIHYRRIRDPWAGRCSASDCSGHSCLSHGTGERVVLSVGLLAA